MNLAEGALPAGGGWVSLPYSGSRLDRAGGRRTDASWIAALLDDGEARLIPVWRDQCLVSGDPPVPAISAEPGRHATLREVSAPVLLGLDGTAGIFAVDLSALPEARALEAAVSVDGEEILEARWFTKAELAEREASGHPLGRPDSIDRYLLRSWLTEKE